MKTEGRIARIITPIAVGAALYFIARQLLQLIYTGRMYLPANPLVLMPGIATGMLIAGAAEFCSARLRVPWKAFLASLGCAAVIAGAFVIGTALTRGRSPQVDVLVLYAGLALAVTTAYWGVRSLCKYLGVNWPE